MNINVTVDEVTLESVLHDSYESPVTVGDRVAHEIVQRLVSDRDGWNSITQRVERVRDEEIREAVRPLIAEALSRPVQQANPYGEPIGKKTTLTAIIVREAQDFMKRKADDSYRSDGKTVLQKMVADEVAAAFKAEVADAVKQARNAVTAEIGAQAGAAMAEAVRGALKAR